MNLNSSSRTQVNDARQVVQLATERLQVVLYPLDVTCELNDGMLILHGRVSTYFQKQLAQEAVINLDGVTQVMNQIEVVGLKP
jgi:hypothetical protein